MVQSTFSPTENLFELLLMIDAAKRASADYIVAVMPYFGFARQDRKDKPRVSIAAKLIANMLTTAGANRIMTMDLHAAQIQAFFDIPFDHLDSSYIFVPYIKKLKLKDLIIAAPDVGGSHRARLYSVHLDTEFLNVLMDLNTLLDLRYYFLIDKIFNCIIILSNYLSNLNNIHEPNFDTLCNNAKKITISDIIKLYTYEYNIKKKYIWTDTNLQEYIKWEKSPTVSSSVSHSFPILLESINKIKIDTEAILGKIEILISKGNLDSAQLLINNQRKILKKFTSYNIKKDLTNQLDYKNTQILFYKGNYSEMNLSLDSLIKQIELKDEKCNDLLEVKTISLFFNQNKEEFKKYSSIQHKIKMNKSFESILELIQLMNTENMLINELAQFQYAIIELEKGNISNAQQIILSMDKETIFYELSLIINAEIEDHINQNYKKAMKLYEKFIEKYPNSIYKENILKRLNEINKLIRKKIDS